MDILHVNHHGSMSSTNSDYMNLLRPKVARHEGRTLIHSALAAAGDIQVTHDELIVSIEPLSSPHKTQALAAVGEKLNETATRFPGTTLRMRFSIKPGPPRSLAFPGLRDPSGGIQPDISNRG